MTRLVVVHQPLVLQVNFVTQNDEGEIVGVLGPSLDQKLVTPRVQVLEGLVHVNVKYEDARVSATCDARECRIFAVTAN